MRNLLVVAVLSVFCGSLPAQDIVRVQKFQLWGELKQVEKMLFFHGFTNGLAASGIMPFKQPVETVAQTCERQQAECD